MTNLFGHLKKNAIKRKLDVAISRQDIIDLYKQQDGRCALTGEILTHICEPGTRRVNIRHTYNISVDRIDSQKPYTIDNIQLVGNRVNTIKWDLDQDDFIALCKKITLYNS
uniref:Zn-finger protein n=1 Tax=Pithovirus LCPAC304 TaxID=2506594 RepID=A0A481Z9H9_9VIRU|nr:MAG: Zn-finger protein [Pithovirus LCPAC304]